MKEKKDSHFRKEIVEISSKKCYGICIFFQYINDMGWMLVKKSINMAFMICLLFVYLTGCSSQNQKGSEIEETDVHVSTEGKVDGIDDGEIISSFSASKLRKEKLKKYYYGNDICSIYVDEQRKVYGWGILDSRPSFRPVLFKEIHDPKDIEVRGSYTVNQWRKYIYDELTDILIVNGDGTVWTRGANQNGILGDGTGEGQYNLTQLSGVSGIKEIAITDSAGIFDEIDADTIVLALKEDKTVLWWGGQKPDGGYNTPQTVEGLAGIEKIWADNHMVYAMNDNKELYYFNTGGIITNNLEIEALVESKTIITTSIDINKLEFGKKGRLNNVVAALDMDGKVYMWDCQYFHGDSTSKLVELEEFYTGIDEAVDIINTGDAVLAVKEDGTVWGIGRNNSYAFTGQYRLGDKYNSPVQLPLTNIIDLIPGKNQFFAINQYGQVLAWGIKNQYIDDGKENKYIETPFIIKDLQNIVDFYAGYNIYLASNSEFETIQWGSEIFELSNQANFEVDESKVPVKRFFMLDNYSLTKPETYMWVKDINAIKSAITHSTGNEDVSVDLTLATEEDYTFTSSKYKYKLIFKGQLPEDINDFNIEEIIQCLREIHEAGNIYMDDDYSHSVVEIVLSDKTDENKKIIIQDDLSVIYYSYTGGVLNTNIHYTDEFERYLQYRVVGFDVDIGAFSNHKPQNNKTWEEAVNYFEQQTGKTINRQVPREYFKKYDDYYYRFYDDSNNEYILNCTTDKIYSRVSGEYKYTLTSLVSDEKGTVYEVHNFKELLESLGSNRTIKLFPGDYDKNLRENYPTIKEEQWDKLYHHFYMAGDQGTAFAGLENLVLEGVANEEGGQIDFISSSSRSSVLELKGCNNITIKNLNMGHVEAPQSCSGDVTILMDSTNIVFENCTMFGCGLNGLVASGCKNVTLKDSIFKDCTNSEIVLAGCENVIFQNCLVQDDNCSIYTSQCNDIIVTDTKIIGTESFPTLMDEWSYAFLTAEDTIWYEYSGESSVIFDQYQDWQMNATFLNVQIGTSRLERKHRQINDKLKDNATAKLIESQIFESKKGIGLGVSYSIDEDTVYNISNITSLLYELAKLIDSEKLEFPAGIEVRISKNNQGTCKVIFENHNDLLEWIKEGSKEKIEDYADMLVDGFNIDAGEFFEIDETLTHYNEIAMLLEENIITYKEPTSGFDGYGKRQEINFEGMTYQDGSVWYYFSVEQEEPLEGDFLYYMEFAKMKVNAATGEFYVVDYKDGDCKASFVSEEIKEIFYNSEETDIRKDLSMFIEVERGEGYRVILVSLHKEEETYYKESILRHSVGLYILIEKDGQWQIERLE